MTTALEAKAKSLYFADGGKHWDNLTVEDANYYLDRARGDNEPAAVTTSTHTIESSQQMNSKAIIENIAKLATIIGPEIVNADIRCYGDSGRLFKITATMKETT